MLGFVFTVLLFWFLLYAARHVLQKRTRLNGLPLPTTSFNRPSINLSLGIFNLQNSHFELGVLSVKFETSALSSLFSTGLTWSAFGRRIVNAFYTLGVLG